MLPSKTGFAVCRNEASGRFGSLEPTEGTEQWSLEAASTKAAKRCPQQRASGAPGEDNKAETAILRTGAAEAP